MMLLSKDVEMRWSYRNRKHFESKGYKFTNINDVFIVNINDLTNGSPIRIRLKCDYCGCEYECYYYSYIKSHAILNKDACKHCASYKSREISYNDRANKKFEAIQNLCSELNYELITNVNEYTHVFMDIEYVCPKHGLQSSIMSNMLKGCGCNKCGNEKIGDALRYNIDDVKEYIEQFNGNIIINLNDYINSKTNNLKIRCGNCGNVFTTSLEHYKAMTRKQCNLCTRRESEGESIIRKYLTDNNIIFIQEKRFIDCRDIYTLPFDFYLPDYNLCIEFDGQHHYEPCYGADRYNKTILHDNIKNNYCKNNNIHLLRIPYWDGHNINEIINDKLNRIKI